MDTCIPLIRYSVVALALALCASYAEAQSTPDPLPETLRIDANGIDVVRGAFNMSVTDVAIGGANGLSYSRVYSGSGWRGSGLGTVTRLSHTAYKYYVSAGATSERFEITGALANGTFASDEGSGGMLDYDSSTQRFTFTGADGSIMIFDGNLANKIGASTSPVGNQAVMVQTIAPNGAVTDYHYKEEAIGGVTRARLQSITNSFGYQLHYTYAVDTPADTTELNGDWVSCCRFRGRQVKLP